MYSKRFRQSREWFIDTVKGRRSLYRDDAVRWLNELNDDFNKLSDENYHLKRDLKYTKILLDTHKHPLWSTREAERILNEKNEEISELTSLLEEEVSKNGKLLSEINDLRIKVMRLESRIDR